MVAEDELFTLIKSLSRSEKGYFKKYASRHVIGEENNYIRLFDFLDGLEKFDEQKVKKHFSGQKFINQLHVTKNYLVRIILQSMRAYRSETVVMAKLSGMIRDIEFLFEKALFRQCRKLLVKAKDTAWYYTLYIPLLELLELERSLVNRLSSFEEIDKGLLNVDEERNQVLKLLQNFSDYVALHERLYMILRKQASTRGTKEENELKKIMNHPLFSSEEHALSFRAKEIFYNTWSIYYNTIGDYENNYKWGKKLVDFVEQHPEQVEFRSRLYITALNNFLFACDRLKKMQEFKVYLDKMKAMKPRSMENRVRLFERVYAYELDYYFITGEYEKALALVPEIEKGLEVYKGKFLKVREIIFYFHLAKLFFGLGEYSKSLHWLNKLLNDSDKGLREDIYSFAKMMNLMIHFEMGNRLLLPYILKSTYRFFVKRNVVYEFEKIFLKNVHRLVRAGSKKELKEVFSDLHKEMLTLSEKQYEKRAFELFDFVSWLESKIQNRPFTSIVIGKYKAV